MRIRRVAVSGLVLGALCLQPSRVGAVGGLQGHELVPAHDLASGIEAVLGHLLGGGQPPQVGIESVVVTEDAPARLTVSVRCSAELEGRKLLGALLGRDHRSQREFRAASVRIADGARDAELLFEPAEGLAQGPLPDSAFLRVSVAGGGSGQLFVLDKAWGSGAGSTSGASVVRVRPRPEPLAAALPSTEPITPPPPTPTPVPVPTPEVRDHRGEHWGGGGVVVRDHRREGRPRPEVRDHRGLAAPTPWVAPAAAPSPGQREAVLSRTTAVLRALPQTTKTFTFDPALFHISAADQGRGARGPNLLEAHDILGDLVSDEIGLETTQVTGIRPLVYADQNPATGLFYFLPETYHLGWLADQGRYDMATLYLAAPTPGSAGEVSMAAGLTAGVDRDEIKVAEELLRAYCRAHGCPAAPELRPFPIDPGRVAVSLAGTLRLFNIPAEKVAPVGLSAALGDFKLAWVTDAVTKENVQLVMEQGGINGSVTFQPPAADASSQLVDVQIKLGDAYSFARSLWRRGEAWRNPTPYPLRLKHLHALVIGSQDRPTVYSWSLGGATVAPGARVEWDASAIPQWLDRKATRFWISYAVAEDCDECNQQALRAITGGVTSVASSEITFHTLNPIAEMGAYEIAVRVRSKRFDPEGRDLQEKSVVLKADNQDFTLGPIYVEEAGSGRPSDPLFEYFLTVAMADGSEHEAERWLQSPDLRVLIGRSQIQQALGFVPGAGPGATPTPRPGPEPQP